MAKQVMLQNIDEHAKEIRKNIGKIKSDTALEKMLIDQKIDALNSDLKKFMTISQAPEYN